MRNIKSTLTLYVAELLCTYTMAQQPQLEWAKSVGGVGQDGGYSIALDSSGNVYTSGYFMDTVTINPGPDSVQLISVGGSADILLTKYDSNGNFIWAKQMGGPFSDQSNSCVVDDSCNVYLTGTFMDTADFDPGPGVFELNSVWERDIFVCKLNSSGDLIWAKQVGGDGYYDVGQNMILDHSDGSILITGVFNGTSDFDPGSGIFNLTANAYDIYVLKLDADGNFKWAGKMGGNGWEFGMGISLNDNGDIFLCGEFEETADFDPRSGEFLMTSLGYADGFVCKLNSEGVFIWAVQMGSVGQDWANSLVVDPSGNVLITGEFLFDVDFDPGSGEYILTSQNWDAFVWKLNTDGNFVWAKKMGGTDFDWGNFITSDAAGNAYTTGFFMTTADFDPGAGQYNLTAGAYWEVYISKLTASGEFAWAAGFTGNVIQDININQGWCIAVDKNNNVYSTGSFESWTDVDPGPEIYLLTAPNEDNGYYYEDAFIHKMSQIPTGIDDKNNSDIIPNEFDLSQNFPNPFNPSTSIQYAISSRQYVTLKVYDVLGNEVATLINEEKPEGSYEINFDASKLSSGVYYYQLRAGSFIETKKMILLK